MGSKAPRHTLNREWREKNVRDPFDYIVIDRSRFDADLMTAGVNIGIFWNIHRLTPVAYRGMKDKTWAVKGVPNRPNPEGEQDRAAYVLENTIDVILKKEANKREVRSIQSQYSYPLTLRTARIPVYRKADKTGDVVWLTPAGMTVIDGRYSTKGLTDKDIYWNVIYQDTQRDGRGALFKDGYILASDLADNDS